MGRMRRSICWVYPRVCGGSKFINDNWGNAEGLSPRVRGKRDGGRRPQRGERSIPACAGEAQPFNVRP